MIAFRPCCHAVRSYSTTTWLITRSRSSLCIARQSRANHENTLSPRFETAALETIDMRRPPAGIGGVYGVPSTGGIVRLEMKPRSTVGISTSLTIVAFPKVFASCRINLDTLE